VKKSGIIKSLNVSPKGFYEGLLLAIGNTVVQVNFPKESHQALLDTLKPQAKATLEVEPEQLRGKPEHEVFSLVRVLGDNASNIRLSAGPQRFSAHVERLNYARHGEVNGAVLESGDFVHLKPEGAAALGIKLGMKLEGLGETRPMVNGRSVIEAKEVNGIAIEHRKAPKKHAR